MKIKNLLYIAAAIVLTACSKADHTNAIPANSTAIIEADAKAFADEESPFHSLMTAFTGGKEDMAGIDASQPIYIFEAIDGSIGMCMALDDDDDFDDFLSQLEADHKASNAIERDGITFRVLNKQWVIGYDSDMMLAMGPVVGVSEESKTIKRMAHLMKQDEERSIKSSAIWSHLAELSSPIRMVAQANALPEKMVAAFTIGAPKGTDPADVLVEADITIKDGIMRLDGKTCSYNPRIKQEMEHAASVYCPISYDWQSLVTDSVVGGIFMNVDGQQYLPLLQANKALNTMLMASDSDYDRIRGNKENMAIILTTDNRKKGDDEDPFTAKVHNLGSGTAKNDEKLIVCLNLNALTGPVKTTIAPFTNSINKIVYTTK